jgi:hypothetical protein
MSIKNVVAVVRTVPVVGVVTVDSFIGEELPLWNISDERFGGSVTVN